MSFLFFFSLLLCASATPYDCNPLKPIIHQVYMNNYQFISLGLPALLVEDMVSHTIWSIANHCSCSDTTVDSLCTQTFLSSAFVVKRIQTETTLDASRSINHKFFPLYHTNSLQPPTDLQITLLYSFLEQDIRASATVPLILSSEWEGIGYPDEGILYHDTSTEQQHACNEFYAVSDDFPTGYPAQLATAYIIGLVQEVRYAGGDISAAKQILQRHVQIVFYALRCTREAWYYLELPVTFIANSARQIKHLLENVAKYSSDSQTIEQVNHTIHKISNITRIADYPWYYFPSMIDYLSSWASYGRSEFYVESAYGVLTATIIEDELNIVSPEQYYNMPKPSPRRCSSGWGYVPRVGFDSGDLASCCAQPCLNMASRYSSIFSLVIDQEVCCAMCNEAGCPGDAMNQVINLFVDNLGERLAFVVSI